MTEASSHPAVDALNAQPCRVAGVNLGFILSLLLSGVLLPLFGAVLVWNMLAAWPPLLDDLALKDRGVPVAGEARASCDGTGAFSSCELELAWRGPDGAARTKTVTLLGFSLDASRAPPDLRADPDDPGRVSTGVGRMELANRIAWQVLVVGVLLALLAILVFWFLDARRQVRAGLGLSREARAVEARVLDASPRGRMTSLLLAWRDPATGAERRGRVMALVDPPPLFLDRAGRRVLAFANARGDVLTADRWLRETTLDEAERERVRRLAEPRLF